jgi:hypothetical protein
MTNSYIYNILQIFDENYFFIPNDIKNLIYDYIPSDSYQIKCYNCNFMDFYNKYNFYECQLCELDNRKYYCHECSKICGICDNLYCEFHKLDYHHICMFCNRKNMIRELQGKYTTYY